MRMLRQGLCVSMRWGDDEGDGGERLVGAAQQAEGGVAQQRHHGRPGRDMAEAAILAEGAVFDVMEGILKGLIGIVNLTERQWGECARGRA